MKNDIGRRTRRTSNDPEHATTPTHPLRRVSSTLQMEGSKVLSSLTPVSPPATLATEILMGMHALVQDALQGHLVVYAGAGISVNAGLPLGAELATALAASLAAMGYAVPTGAERDLLALSDFVEAEGGLRLLQGMCLEAAPFATADATSEHVSLALLLVEGAITAVTSNWDTCIERALPEDPISAVVTDEDRLLYVGARLFKVHGCAKRPPTLLVSTSQLANPLAWASADVTAALGNATVIFLGIGDVAPHVKVRLTDLLAKIGNIDHIRVVSPNIKTGWPGSDWSALLATLPEANRIEQSAAAFAEDLLRGWVRAALQKGQTTASGLSPEMETAYGSLVSHLSANTAADVVGLLRRARADCTPRTQSIQAPATADALLALAALAKGGEVDLPTHGWTLSVLGEPVELLIGDGHMTGLSAAEEARARISKRRSQGQIGPDETASVICSGCKGPVTPRTASVLEDDIVAIATSGDLIDGPGAGPTIVRRADDLIDAAAA